MKLCDEYAALLDLYVDGELEPAQMVQVQAHLDTCPACRQYVDDALAIRAAFPDAEDVELPECFHDAVMAAVAADAAKAKKSRKKVWKSLLPLAACFAVVLVVGGRSGVMAPRTESTSAAASVTTADAVYQSENETAAPASSAPAETSLALTSQTPAAINEPAAKGGTDSVQAAAESRSTARKAKERNYFAVLHWGGDVEDLSLPADCTPITLEDGTTGYELSRADYEALLEKLDAKVFSVAISYDTDADLALIILEDE